MDSSDVTILHTASEWLTYEKELLLATVASTWGSSPRPVGSMMLIKSDGEFVGSISGGCIEDDLINRYLDSKLPNKKVSMISYGVGQLDAQKYGLPCGGKLEVVIEKLGVNDSFEIITQSSQEKLPVARHLNTQTGEISYSLCNYNEKSSFDGENLHKVFGPQWQLLLIGANELSKFVAQIAQSLNYQIIICDPREHTYSDWIDDNMTFSTNMPDEEVASLSPVEQSIVLALTHDPKMDDMALMQALNMDLFYVGAVGSHKTQTSRRKRLKQLDLTEEQISKLHGPVGLSIGSKTPAEIAISILAEITAERHYCETSITSKQALQLELA